MSDGVKIEQDLQHKPWLDEAAKRRIEKDKEIRDEIDEALSLIKDKHPAFRDEILDQMRNENPNHVYYIDEEWEKRRKSSTSNKRNFNFNINSTTPVNNEYIFLPRVPLTEPQFLIEDFLTSDCINLVYGNGGMGKSYLALYIAVLVASGKSFLGNVVKKGKVLYVDFELSPELQRQRLERICKGLDIDPNSFNPTDLLYITPINLSEFIPTILNHQMDLIIIDSIGAGLSGDPEAARDICGLFQQLRQLGTVLLLDHQSKMQKGDRANTKTPFGSVYKFNLSRNIYHLNAVQGEDNKLNCLLKHTKCNFSALRQPIGLEFDFSQSSFVVNKCEPGLEFVEHLGVKEQIIVALRELGKATAQEIADEAGLELGSARAKISLLKKAGEIEEVGKEGHASIYSLGNFNKPGRVVNVKVNENKPAVQSFIQGVIEELDAEIVNEKDVPF